MSLDYQLSLVADRAERFRELKEAYSRGEYPKDKSFEKNDFINLRNRSYQSLWNDIEIPQDLVDEGIEILRETDELGFGLMESPSEEERRKNQTKYVELFGRCESVERRLYQIISDYRENHPEDTTRKSK